MQRSTPALTTAMIPLENFGILEKRYQTLKLSERAGAILKDADPALVAAEQILKSLAEFPETQRMFVDLRKNSLIIGKMRPSEAKNMLMDSSCDFTQGTRNKLAAWRKTIERLSQGEAIMSEGDREFIPGHAPLALAIMGNACVSNYLSIIQLVLAELAKSDASFTSSHAELRRCATILSDCEAASGIDKMVH